MNSFMLPDDILLGATQLFHVDRNDRRIGESHGFFCDDEYPSTIQLVENVNIKCGDWLTDSISGQRYYVLEAHPIMVDGIPLDWMVKYQSEAEYLSSTSHAGDTTFNIHSISGNSVIGNQQSVTMNIGCSLSDIRELISGFTPSDQQLANELVEELENIESSNHPVLFKGMFSRFSDLLSKHSDLVVALGGWAIELLKG